MAQHTSIRQIARGTSALVSILAAMQAAPALAQAAPLPTGGNVAAGSATIGVPSGTTQVITQTSDRAVINWTSFDIASGYSVNFAQPDASSATLNRVTGDTTSVIAGTLQANGSVFLVNPNGIQITSSGSVKVGRGFIASTLDIADDDFLTGAGAFAGTGGTVTLDGTIATGSGGFVGLLGGNITSHGLIAAPMGQVVIGAVSQATLDLNGDNFLQVALPQNALVSTDGQLAAISTADAINAVRNAVYLPATIDTNSVSGTSGQITLGGTITVDSATGDAGRIMVMGNDVVANGVLSARATGASGNGGMIETSGNQIDFVGIKVDTSAAAGTTGTWLIDPTNLTIDVAAAATIQSNLTTSNVTLQTTDSGASGPGTTSDGAGDIIIAAPINWSANTLTLDAYHGIGINAVLTASGTAGLVMNTANGGTIDVGMTSSGFTGRVDFTGAGNSLRINGTDYTIITALGVAGSTSGTDLQGMTGDLAGHYALGADIDASATSAWNGGAGFMPIGDGTTLFTGTFEGLGHVITGLAIDQPSATYTGLFGAIGPYTVVSNVGLAGGVIRGRASGGYYTYTGGLVGLNTGTVRRSYFSGSVYGQENVGGLVGANDFAIVTQSFASGTVSGGGNSTGGLVGRSTNSTISQSQTSSTVNGNNDVGGLVGFNEHSLVLDSQSSGTVTGTGNNTGGLVGYLLTGSVARSSSSATVIGNYAAGGLVGTNNSGEVGYSHATGAVSGADFAGGLIGLNVGLELLKFLPLLGVVNWSYATGNVTATGRGAGGLIGGGGALTAVADSYATGAVTGQLDVGGLMGANAGFVRRSYATGSAKGDQNVGGLIGSFMNTMPELGDNVVTDTYATGAVEGATNVGGLVGNYDSGVLKDSYWDSYSTTMASGIGGGASAAAATNIAAVTSDPTKSGDANYAYKASAWSNFAAGSIDTVGGQSTTWRMYDGYTMPLLKTFLTTVTVNTNTDTTYHEYDGNLQYSSAGYSLGGDADPSKVFGTASLWAGPDAGTAVPINISFSSLYSNQQGYDLILGTPGTMTISPRPVTVIYTANAVSSIYGDTPSGLGGSFSASGLINGDTLSGSAAWSTLATGASGVGSYAITGSGLTAGSNYAVIAQQAAGNATALTITPRLLTITADELSRHYGEANPLLTYAVGGMGLVNGDSLTGALTTAADVTSGVASYAITQGTLAASGNYAVTYVGANLAITPRPLTITADELTRYYGEANPALTYAVGGLGLVNGDGLTGALTTTADVTSGVGTYAIAQGTVAASSNYAVTYVGANLVINPRPLTITADELERLFGAPNPPLTYTVSGMGLVFGDTLSGELATAAVLGSKVGSYAITQGTLTAGANYAITFVGANLKINQRVLTTPYPLKLFPSGLRTGEDGGDSPYPAKSGQSGSGADGTPTLNPLGLTVDLGGGADTRPADCQGAKGRDRADCAVQGAR